MDTLPLEKNQQYTAEITGYTSDGAGVCRVRGRAVFVKGALEGETWEIRILKVTASAVYARGEHLLSPSPARISPACPYFEKCGGCDLLHMDYEEELRFKKGRVDDALRRIGGLDLTVSEILGADSREGYRNKGICAVGGANGKPIAGFFRPRSHDIVPVDRCLIQPELMARANRAVIAWMAENGVAPYAEATGRGSVRHIFTRCARATGQAVCCVVSARGFGPKTGALVQALRRACPELTGIVLNINRSRGNTVLAGDFHTLWGSDTLEDVLCGFRFTLSPLSFFQINPVQTEMLYGRALEFAALAGGTALDLYCGAGTISLCLSRAADRVIGAEIVPPAVENARKNAAANGVKNVEFLCADCAEAAAALAARGERPEVVVVDPPRKGLVADVIGSIAGMGPRRVVYVSCDPGTLARDLRHFAQLGYAPRKATAVDMFPGTRHVETIVLLQRGTL